MIINAADSQYLNIYGRGNTAWKLNDAGAVNIPMIVAGAKTAKEDFGFSISISEESKAKLEQLNEEKKQKETDLQSEGNSPAADIVRSAKTLEVILNDTTGKSGLGTYIGRMYHAAHKEYDVGDGGVTTAPTFSGLASAYAEIREELVAKYSGEELEKHIAWLDADYEFVTERVTEGIVNAVRFFAAAKQEPAGPLKDVFRQMKTKMNIDFGDPDYMDKVDAFVKTLKDAVMRILELSRQYISEGNSAPGTEESKKDFADYLKKNTAAIDIFSLDSMF